MARYYIDLNNEAEKIYKSWQRDNRSKNTSQAIIEYDKKTNSLFTPEQEQRIRDIIREVLDK